MSTNLGRRFPPTVPYYPTHMSPEDYKLYKRWAVEGLKEAINVYYDVGLGEGTDPGSELDPSLKKMWTKVTQKRADAVVEYMDHVDIVELRFNATSNAIGRLLSYRMLWNDDPAIKKVSSFILVTNRFDPELLRLSGDHGLHYVIV